MHVIDRTDAFTLVAQTAARQADALRRRGPVTGARSSTSPSVSRTSARRSHNSRKARARPAAAGEAYFDVAEGLRLGLVEADRDVDYDLDHVALLAEDPRRRSKGGSSWA